MVNGGFRRQRSLTIEIIQVKDFDNLNNGS